MKAFTYTLIVGNMACTNNCRVCIAKMNPDHDIDRHDPRDIDWNKFERAADIAVKHQTQNILLTGKGEPTLFPDLVSEYLRRLSKRDFKKIEIQTAGAPLMKSSYDKYLDKWRKLGLKYISISIYHYKEQKNKEVFKPRSGKYFDVWKLVKKLKSKGYKIRLSCCMLKGYIDSAKEIKILLEYCKKYEIDQLSLRRADVPHHPHNKVVAKYVMKHRLDFEDDGFKKILHYILNTGKLDYMLPIGAPIFNVSGQNISVNTGLCDCEKKTEELRQLIWFPQGWLTTSWENVQGGRLL